jgi:hypothetical protein
VGFFVFGEQNNSRSIFVDAVHKTKSRVGSIKTGRIFEMPSQGIEQSPPVISDTRMNDHSRIFIDQYKVAVFVNDMNGNIFGNDLKVVRRIGKYDRNYIMRFYAVIGFYRFPVYNDAIGVCRILYPVARNLRHAAN